MLELERLVLHTGAAHAHATAALIAPVRKRVHAAPHAGRENMYALTSSNNLLKYRIAGATCSDAALRMQH